MRIYAELGLKHLAALEDMWCFIQYCKDRDDTPEKFFADRFEECAVKYRPLSM
jgi:hypothetical protein